MNTLCSRCENAGLVSHSDAVIELGVVPAVDAQIRCAGRHTSRAQMAGIDFIGTLSG